MILSTKKIGILFIVMFFGSISSFGFAQTTQGDCTGEVSKYIPKDYPPIVIQSMENKEQEKLHFYTNKDLEVAITHLQRACCEKKHFSDSICKTIEKGGPKRFPQSQYLFDHLMFIGLKKMEGNEEHCKILGIDCTLRNYPIEPVRWREEIRAIGKNTDGMLPSRILETFKKYRGDEKSLIDVSQYTMFKGYFWMCTDAISVRYAVGTDQGERDKYKDLNDLCMSAVHNRYSKEAQYVSTLQVQQGSEFFLDNLKSYLMHYFVDERLAGLTKKYSALDSCFTSVLKYVQKTTCCNE